LSGLVIASSPAELEELFDDLANLPTKGEAVAETVRGLHSLNVGLALAADVRALTDVIGRYTLQVIAYDPLKYGPEVTVSTGLPSLTGGLEFPIVFPIDFNTSGDPGRLTLPNVGRQSSWPRF